MAANNRIANERYHEWMEHFDRLTKSQTESKKEPPKKDNADEIKSIKEKTTLPDCDVCECSPCDCNWGN